MIHTISQTTFLFPSTTLNPISQDLIEWSDECETQQCKTNVTGRVVLAQCLGCRRAETASLRPVNQLFNFGMVSPSSLFTSVLGFNERLSFTFAGICIHLAFAFICIHLPAVQNSRKCERQMPANVNGILANVSRTCRWYSRTKAAKSFSEQNSQSYSTHACSEPA